MKTIWQSNKPPITITIPGGDLCSNYRAKAQALLTATETVTQLETRPKKVVLLTDSLSVLHLTKFNTTFKQPDIKNNSRASMDTCTYRHTWKRSGRSAGERGKQEAAAKIQTLIRNKRLADFKHRNGGYNPQPDTLRLLSRHEQTMIFRLRTGHCRLRSHMKKIGITRLALKSQPFAPADW